MEGKRVCELTIEALRRKKARDIVILEIGRLTTIANYFIICSGTSTTHIQSLSDEVEDDLEKNGINFLRKEGYHSARWILLDYGEVVVHIFHQEDREFYGLERLWQDAEKRMVSG